MTSQSDSTLEHIDYSPRQLPIHHVRSADGTTIAYEKTGSGPPVVIIGGGLNEKDMHAELAEGLSRNFTVYNYDRRARGASEDRTLGAYRVEREIEDLNAVIAAAGEACAVFANCTGGMIAVPAAAAGSQITRLAMYEPPYGAPQTPEHYLPELNRLLAQGDRTEAVALFLKFDALFTDEEITFFKDHPIWPAFEAMADSMPYDSELSRVGASIPVAQLAQVPVPTLVLAGQESPDWMIANCEAVAAGIPAGRAQLMQTAGHLMDDIVGARILTDFFLDPNVPSARSARGREPWLRRSTRALRVRRR